MGYRRVWPIKPIGCEWSEKGVNVAFPIQERLDAYRVLECQIEQLNTQHTTDFADQQLCFNARRQSDMHTD